MKYKKNLTSLAIIFLLILCSMNILNKNSQILNNKTGLGTNQIGSQQEIQQILNKFPNLRQSISTGKTPNNKKSISIPFSGFVQNVGQSSNPDILYYYTTPSSSIGFSTSKIQFIQKVNISESQSKFVYFTISFIGSNRINPVGISQMKHSTNYFTNSKEITGIKSYQEVWFYNIYNHIDLRYYMTNNGMKYEFIINPGGNPNDIVITPSSNVKTAVTDNKISLLSTSLANFEIIADGHLAVTQDGMNIAAKFSKSPYSMNSYGFQINKYDPNQKLIIDPLLIGFSTFLGGNGNDQGRGIAVDSAGNTYITGGTYSTNFPTSTGAFNRSYSGLEDVFVTKLNATGNGIEFSTYFGGNSQDVGLSIAIDSAGNSYITGNTNSSSGFPLVNAYQSTFGGGISYGDAFVTKLNATGNGIDFSTYLGGTGDDYGYSIAVFDNCSYIVGATKGSGFPLAKAIQPTLGGVFDAFITKLNTTGNGIDFSTYLGGSAFDEALSIAIDSAGNSYITGDTASSTDFPLVSPYQSSYGGGGQDAFVTKINATGTGIGFSTYLGGIGNDIGNGIALDSHNNCYITGYTASSDFPSVKAYQPSLNGISDAFVTEFNTNGNNIIFSTFLGGTGNDHAIGIKVDYAGLIYITGYTSSGDFPLVKPYSYSFGGYIDVFITEFSANGTGIIFSTYIGGVGDDYGEAIAVDFAGNIYVTGTTSSQTTFPLLHAYQKIIGGGSDAFVLKIKSRLFSTYLGGNAEDQGNAIAVDSYGNSYITGITYSTSGFPLVNAQNSTFGGNQDAFIIKLNSTGNGIIFSTYIGGAKSDYAMGIAVDSAGNSYIGGYTQSSTDFPIVNAYQSTFGGGTADAFVMKLNSTGNGIVFSTYVGGTGNDLAFAIAIDSAGNSYITGQTYSSSGFPTKNAFNSTFSGGSDAFVTKLNATGNGLIFSTYLGGSQYETGYGIAVDSAGNSYIDGWTSSTNFPVKKAVRSYFSYGTYDGFVTKLNSTGNGIDFSTYLGGTGTDEAHGIAVDSAGNTYVTGYTYSSSGFPLVNAYQSTFGGGSDAFITKLNSTGTGIVFSTYFGGSRYDEALSIAVDSVDNIYITGTTSSNTDFPLVDAYQSTFGGGSSYGDAFITKLNATGTGLDFSTYVGGKKDEFGYGIAVDSVGNCYITGFTNSNTTFPLINAVQSTYGGDSYDVFVFKLTDFTYDNFPPLNLLTPENNSIISPTTTLYFHLVDLNTQFMQFNYTWNGGSIYTVNLFSTGTNYSIQMPVPNSNGLNNLTMYLKDSGNNIRSYNYSFFVDNIVPSIYLLSPSENSILHSGTIINLSISDNTALNQTLYHWDYNSNTTISGNILLPTGDGPHTLYIYGQDQVGNWNSSVLTFQTDDTSPVINLITPVQNNFYPSGTIITLSISDNTGLNQSLYHWDNNSNATVSSNFILPTGDGSHILYIYAQDLAGNWATAQYTFQTDDTGPVINLITPSQNNFYQSGTQISIDISDNSGISQSLYHWDNGSNATISGNILLPSGDGTHTLYIYAQDQTGNWNSAQFIFKTDDTAPIIQLQNIVNNAIIKPGTDININITELNIQNTYYYWDQSQSNTTLTNPYYVVEPAAEAIHTLHVFVVDKAGNWANSAFSFQTDSEKPNIIINKSGYTNVSGTMDLNFTATDNFGLKSISYKIESTNFANLTTLNINGKILEYKVSKSIDFSTLQNGDYILNITIMDIAGNVNSSLITITVNNNVGSQNNTGSQNTNNPNQSNLGATWAYIIEIITIVVIGFIVSYQTSPFVKEHVNSMVKNIRNLRNK